MTPPYTLEDHDPGIAAIIEAAGREFGISVRQILSERRQRDVVEARHVAMWLARELTWRSYPAVGRIFRRDHTSVIHAISRVDELMLGNASLAVQIRRLRATLEVVPRPAASTPSWGTEHVKEGSEHASEEAKHARQGRIRPDAAALAEIEAAIREQGHVLPYKSPRAWPA